MSRRRRRRPKRSSSKQSNQVNEKKETKKECVTNEEGEEDEEDEEEGVNGAAGEGGVGASEEDGACGLSNPPTKTETDAVTGSVWTHTKPVLCMHADMRDGTASGGSTTFGGTAATLVTGSMDSQASVSAHLTRH